MAVKLHRVRYGSECEVLYLTFVSNDGMPGHPVLEFYHEIPLTELKENNSCEMQYNAQDYPTGYKVRN